MEKLTKRQQEIYNLIREHILETGMPPTRMDIANHFGFRSPNAAEDHLRALERKGAIEMIPGTSRGIRLLDEVEPGIPIIGEVAAGYPVLAEENIHSYCDVPPTMFTPNADYFLKVKGLSMQDAGIYDGDLLAVHKTTEARKGQIVVARLGTEVTVKRFDKKRNTVFLHPENDDFDVIEVDSKSEDFSIEGIGVGIIRDGV